MFRFLSLEFPLGRGREKSAHWQGNASGTFIYLGVPEPIQARTTDQIPPLQSDGKHLLSKEKWSDMYIFQKKRGVDRWNKTDKNIEELLNVVDGYGGELSGYLLYFHICLKSI